MASRRPASYDHDQRGDCVTTPRAPVGHPSAGLPRRSRAIRFAMRWRRTAGIALMTAVVALAAAACSSGPVVTLPAYRLDTAAPRLKPRSLLPRPRTSKAKRLARLRPGPRRRPQRERWRLVPTLRWCRQPSGRPWRHSSGRVARSRPARSLGTGRRVWCDVRPTTSASSRSQVLEESSSTDPLTHS